MPKSFEQLADLATRKGYMIQKYDDDVRHGYYVREGKPRGTTPDGRPHHRFVPRKEGERMVFHRTLAEVEATLSRL